MPETDAPREIAFAEGPDGQVWLRRSDVTHYLTDTATFVAASEEIDSEVRVLVGRYLFSIAKAFEEAQTANNEN